MTAVILATFAVQVIVNAEPGFSRLLQCRD